MLNPALSKDSEALVYSGKSQIESVVVPRAELRGGGESTQKGPRGCGGAELLRADAGRPPVRTQGAVGWLQG